MNATRNATEPTPPIKPRWSHRILATLAWLVIFASFALFCGLVYLAVTAVNTALSQATEPQHATFVSITGDVHIKRGTSANLIGVDPDMPNTQDLSEGDVLQVGSGSKATLRLFDDSSVTVAENTQLTVQQLHTLRYFNQRERAIRLFVSTYCKQGCTVPKSSMTIAPTPGTEYKQNTLSIQTEYGGALDLDTITAKDHRYGIWLEQNNGVGVTYVTSDKADNEPVTVTAQGEAVTLAPNKQVTATQGKKPVLADIARDLINNGAFLDPLDPFWQDISNQGEDQQDTPIGLHNIVSIITDDGSFYNALHLHRYGQSDYFLTGVQQNIGYDIPDYIKSIDLSFTYNVVDQSVTGGGAQSSEFPLTVEVDYQSKSGPQRWFVNFYIKLPTTGLTTVLPNSDLNRSVNAKLDWNESETFDLMQLSARVKPTRIDSIKIVASGHNYDSYITNIHLNANNGG